MSDNIDFMNRQEFTVSSDANSVPDRVLLVEGKQFHVNSVLLAQASDFFDGLFNSNFKEKKQKDIELKDVSAADFEAFQLTVNTEDAEVTDETFSASFRLAGRFLSSSVLSKCFDYIKSGQNFDKFPTKDLLEWSQGQGYAEMKELIEERLISSINHFSGITEKVRNCLLFSTEAGMEKLKKAVRSAISNAVREYPETGNNLLLEHMFVINIDVETKQIAEEILTDLFSSEYHQNAMFHIYYKISKQFNLEMLQAVSNNFLETKIINPDQLKDIFIILDPNNEVMPSVNDDEEIQIIWPPAVKKRRMAPSNGIVEALVAAILEKSFNSMDHSEVNLSILLDLSNKFHFVSLQNEVCTFLENDFIANQHFKYMNLAFHYNLEQLLILMRYRLRTANPATFSEEDKNSMFNNSREVKDFVFRNLLNM